MNATHRYFSRMNLEGKEQVYTLAELSHVHSLKFEDYVRQNYSVVECEQDIDDDIYNLLSLRTDDVDLAVAYHYIKTIAALMALADHHEYIDNPLIMQYVRPQFLESEGAEVIFDSLQDMLEDYFDRANHCVYLKDSDTIVGAELIRHYYSRITNKHTRIFCCFGDWFVAKGADVICSSLPSIMVSYLNEYCLRYSEHPEPMPTADIGW